MGPLSPCPSSEPISPGSPYRVAVPGIEAHPVTLEHLVMALDRTLTTLDPGRGARRMAADVRQALTEALASLSSARRALRLGGGPPSTPEREGFIEELEGLSTWLRTYVGTLAEVPGAERFSVEVPYLKIKGLRDRALEQRLQWTPPVPPRPPLAAPPAHSPVRAPPRGGPAAGTRRSGSLRKRKGR